MHRAALLALLTGLAGCGTAARIAPPLPSGPPPGVEGRYRGTARLVHAAGRFCPRSGPRTYQVQDGAISLSYQGEGRHRVVLTAPIGGDGRFDVSDGVGRLQGQAVNGQIQMTIGSSACEHHWTMHRID